MEAEIWQRLPEELLFMILARLPIRVLGKMRSVYKQWNYHLSSRDALHLIGPNWSLHSTPGFLIQFGCNIGFNWIDDVEYWVIEGLGSYIYNLPFPNCIVVDSCKGIFCCRTKWDPLDLSIGIPGTGSWRQLPRPPLLPLPLPFNGMAFDSSTRRCTLLLSHYWIGPRRGSLRRLQGCGLRRLQGQDENPTIVMYIYDSHSNTWIADFMIVPNNTRPCGMAIFSKGKFYWATDTSSIIAFNIVDGLWTEIQLPEGCRLLYPQKLGVYDGQVVLLDRKEVCICVWKLNEAKKAEIWFELSDSSFTTPHLVAVYNSELVMVIDPNMEMWIFNSKGKLIVSKMRLPFATSQVRRVGSAFEFDNLYWP